MHWAYNNYVKKAIASKIISIRVIGTKFTFYFTNVPINYLNALSYGLPLENIVIIRYPDSDLGLDYKTLQTEKLLLT